MTVHLLEEEKTGFIRFNFSSVAHYIHVLICFCGLRVHLSLGKIQMEKFAVLLIKLSVVQNLQVVVS